MGDYPPINRWLLLPYPALALTIGLAYIYGDDSRTQIPAYEAARSIATMHTWGLIFILGFIAMGLAIVTGNRTIIAASLFIGGCVYTWWSALFLVSALNTASASISAWAVYAVVAYSHYVAAWRARVSWNPR